MLRREKNERSCRRYTSLDSKALDIWEIDAEQRRKEKEKEEEQGMRRERSASMNIERFILGSTVPCSMWHLVWAGNNSGPPSREHGKHKWW